MKYQYPNKKPKKTLNIFHRTRKKILKRRVEGKIKKTIPIKLGMVAEYFNAIRFISK